MSIVFPYVRCHRSLLRSLIEVKRIFSVVRHFAYSVSGTDKASSFRKGPIKLRNGCSKNETNLDISLDVRAVGLVIFYRRRNNAKARQF